MLPGSKSLNQRLGSNKDSEVIFAGDDTVPLLEDSLVEIRLNKDSLALEDAKTAANEPS